VAGMTRASTFTYRYRVWLRLFLPVCGTLMRAQAPHAPRRPALPLSEALPSPPAADLLPARSRVPPTPTRVLASAAVPTKRAPEADA
jgi:hypothetical protein